MIKESNAGYDTSKENSDNTIINVSNHEKIVTLVKIPLNQLKSNHMFKCQKCSTYFDDHLILENHLTSIHPDVQAQFQCLECVQRPKWVFRAGSEASKNLTNFETHLAKFHQNDRKKLIEMTSPQQQVRFVPF